MKHRNRSHFVCALATVAALALSVQTSVGQGVTTSSIAGIGTTISATSSRMAPGSAALRIAGAMRAAESGIAAIA